MITFIRLELSCDIDAVADVGLVSFVKVNFLLFGGNNGARFFTVAVTTQESLKTLWFRLFFYSIGNALSRVNN